MACRIGEVGHIASSVIDVKASGQARINHMNQVLQIFAHPVVDEKWFHNCDWMNGIQMPRNWQIHQVNQSPKGNL